MGGLDKIINGIELEAENEAKRIIAEAEGKAERITVKAESEASELIKNAEEAAETEYSRMIALAESAGEVEASRAVLREKQRIINDVMAAAKTELINAPDSEYFDFLEKLLDKYAKNEPGEIILSAKDKKRVTDTFRAALSNKGLVISDTDGADEGGFVIAYGDIDENCTIAALTESESDMLHDVVSNTLF